MTTSRACRHALRFACWLLVLGCVGCTTYAYVDFKRLRQTVPWVTPAMISVVWGGTACPDLSGAYRRGEALYAKFPSPWGNNEQKELNIRPVTVTIRVSKWPFLLPPLPPNYTEEQWISQAQEESRLRQQFYARSIAHLSREGHSLIFRVTDNDRYERIASFDLQQIGIGCTDGKLVIHQIFDGGIQYEGKVNEYVRARETQFRPLPNGDLEVVTYSLNWYGKGTSAPDWKRDSFVYEQIK